MDVYKEKHTHTQKKKKKKSTSSMNLRILLRMLKQSVAGIQSKSDLKNSNSKTVLQVDVGYGGYQTDP